MTNKEIANAFNELAKLMELHKENPFKIRSYNSAYINIRKLTTPLGDMSEAEISGMKGIGKAITGKIGELLAKGEMDKLEEYRTKTPQGIRDLLGIKGFGPSKIRVLWKELGLESPGEVLYACNENRLIALKGFGAKTQEDLRKKLEYFNQSRDKFLYAHVEEDAHILLQLIRKTFPDARIEFTGAFRRKNPILSEVAFLLGAVVEEEVFSKIQDLEFHSKNDNIYSFNYNNKIPVKIFTCAAEEFGSKLFRYTGGEHFIKTFLKKSAAKDFKNIESEKNVFEKAKLPYIAPELRDLKNIFDKNNFTPIQEADILGVLHVHTTYSDGIHSLEEMVEAAREKGYQYIGITDHSQAAFYANGLKPDRVLEQMEAIDNLNKKYTDFKIFKGIESDILNDGNLDYEEEILKKFDFIIASVHSNLRMDKEKATSRILKAIENPYTTILGHPTGRLLLAREGYPLDHEKVIDACAANQIAIELNANPLRLDLDWTWIDYAMTKGVKIAINPDAHSMDGIDHIRFGVYAARKGGLDKSSCLNALNADEFSGFLKK